MLLHGRGSVDVDVNSLDVGVVGQRVFTFEKSQQALTIFLTTFALPNSRPIPDCLKPPNGTLLCS